MNSSSNPAGLPPEREALPAELQALGEALRSLPRATPEDDLAARTVARIKSERELAPQAAVAAPVTDSTRRRITNLSFWFRPITHPVARLAAAVGLVSFLALFSNLDTAEKFGQVTGRMIGEKATARVEQILERVLTAYGPVPLRDSDLDRLIGGHGAARPIDLPQPQPSSGHQSNRDREPGRPATAGGSWLGSSYACV